MTRAGRRGVESVTATRSEVGRPIVLAGVASGRLFSVRSAAGGATRDTTGRAIALVGGADAGRSALIPSRLSRVGSNAILPSSCELFRFLMFFS